MLKLVRTVLFLALCLVADGIVRGRIPSSSTGIKKSNGNILRRELRGSIAPRRELKHSGDKSEPGTEAPVDEPAEPETDAAEPDSERDSEVEETEEPETEGEDGTEKDVSDSKSKKSEKKSEPEPEPAPEPAKDESEEDGDEEDSAAPTFAPTPKSEHPSRTSTWVMALTVIGIFVVLAILIYLVRYVCFTRAYPAYQPIPSN